MKLHMCAQYRHSTFLFSARLGGSSGMEPQEMETKQGWQPAPIMGPFSPTNCPVILSCPRLAAVATCNVACSFPETLGILQFLSTVTNIHRKAWLLAHTQEACSWHTQEAPAAPNIREAEAAVTALGTQFLQSGHVGHVGAAAYKGW